MDNFFNISKILEELKSEFRIQTNDDIYKFFVSEKGNLLLDAILFDIRLTPILELQRNIIHLTFDSYKQESIFKEAIKNNNDKIHFLINDFFKSNPEYSFNVYKLFYRYLFNGEKFEKIKSFYLNELPKLNFEKSGNIKSFYFKILIAFCYSEIKKTNRTSINFEELEFIFETMFEEYFSKQILYSSTYISELESHYGYANKKYGIS